jgi:hypothetical protein
MAYWAKGVAAAATGQIGISLRHQEAFRAGAVAVPADRHVHMVSSSLTLAVADKMLDGEISYRQAALLQAQQHQQPSPDDSYRELFAKAFSLLQEARELDEGLPYDEPWGWMTPVAHALGALLLEQGHVQSAMVVFREDLARWPNNMWSLQGLKRCLEAVAEKDENEEMSCCGGGELERVRGRLAIAAARADISLDHACLCAGLLPADCDERDGGVNV